MFYSDNKYVDKPKESKSFGHTLINVFTGQLEGNYIRTIDDGTTYNFLFKEILAPIVKE